MNEQIVLTQGDYGAELQVQFVTNKKVPIDITGCTIEVVFTMPDGTAIRQYPYIINAITGICGFILTDAHSTLTGVHSTYWSATDENEFVTAQEGLYYYVMPVHGGNTTEV